MRNTSPQYAPMCGQVHALRYLRSRMYQWISISRVYSFNKNPFKTQARYLMQSMKNKNKMENKRERHTWLLSMEDV